MKCKNCTSRTDLHYGSPRGDKLGPFCIECWGKIKICDGCNAAVFDDSIQQHGNGLFCGLCQESLNICTECGETGSFAWLTDEIKARVPKRFHSHCGACFDKRATVCTECDTYIGKDRYKTKEGFKDSKYLLHEKNELLPHQYPTVYKKHPENTICASCFRKKTKGKEPAPVKKCKWCAEPFHLNPNRDHGSVLCAGCAEYAFTCNHCKQVKDRRVTRKEENNTCTRCVKKYYNKCTNCRVYELKPKNHQTELPIQKFLCKTCDSTKAVCISCGGVARKNRSTHTKHGYLCNGCNSGENKWGYCEICDTLSYSLANYKDSKLNVSVLKCRTCAAKDHNAAPIECYTFKPSPIFHGQSKNGLWYGLEIEISTDGDNDQLVNNLNDLYKAFPEELLYAKSDSSVENGFEIVTNPLSFEYIKKLASNSKKNELAYNWATLFDGVYKKSDSCGMHVHMSRAAFTDLQLFKFITFFQRNEKFLFKLAGRGYNGFASKIRTPTTTVVKRNQSDGRHSFINVADVTVEVRLFAGITSEEELLRNVELLEAIFQYTSSHSIVDTKNKKKFIEFINQYGKRYENLIESL